MGIEIKIEIIIGYCIFFFMVENWVLWYFKNWVKDIINPINNAIMIKI